MTDSTQSTLTGVTSDDDENTVHETYVTALHNDSAVIPADAWRVGVVNIPMYGLEDVTETNFECLGPPDELFEDFRAERDEREANGLSKTDAHNTAWDAVSFAETYREHLEAEWRAGSEIREASEEILSELTDRPVAIVCYEGAEKRCHRHVLQSFLQSKHTESNNHE